MTLNRKETNESQNAVELASAMIAEARERIEAEHRHAAPLSLLSKIVMIVAILATLAAGTATIYGIGWLPSDIPIRQSGDAFFGKTGKAHTREEFYAYNRWTTAMFGTYPASIGMWFVFAALRKRDARNR